MLRFDFARPQDRALRVLCVGAHSDDIEIGCGGTILRLLSECDDAEVHWVVLGSNGERDGEAVASAERFLAGARKKEILVEHFKNSFFPYLGAEIKEFFEKLKMKIAPDIVFTHYRHDLHQDHRLVSELTWNTYRSHLILEYEILKYDGDLGVPNLFVHLDEAVCQRKIQTLMECFGTQRDKDWFTPDAFLALLRIRGIESRAPGKYAEAFYCRKVVV
ncbi:MAG: PIG-L domain-containing protein [Candidatus Rokuibacteriota bacterium]|nr:MAG: PIG-L domain-containing protein [Candidatus Rokubacteria bacterium]